MSHEKLTRADKLYNNKIQKEIDRLERNKMIFKTDSADKAQFNKLISYLKSLMR